jgi:hypothetical protein
LQRLIFGLRFGLRFVYGIANFGLRRKKSKRLQKVLDKWWCNVVEYSRSWEFFISHLQKIFQCVLAGKAFRQKGIAWMPFSFFFGENA